MKALQLLETNKALRLKQVTPPIANTSKAIVQIKSAALNHRDLWIKLGQYAGIKMPIILGSDGAGLYKNKNVIINPALNWATQTPFPPKSFKILGLPDNGTFAEQVLVPKRNIYPKPRHLSMAEAAALPLAGLTAYRVLFSRCRLRKNDRVLISGIGGGVALMAMQFAIANGAEVWVTSSSKQKIKKAILMGAAGGVQYTQDDWDKKLLLATIENTKKSDAGFDVIIDSAAGNGFAKLVKLVKAGGRIGLYGGTTGKIQNVIPQIVFWKQINILGSTMGSGAEFSKMLAFVIKNKITPVIDKVYDLKDGNQAFKRMASGNHFGKIVLTVD